MRLRLFFLQLATPQGGRIVDKFLQQLAEIDGKIDAILAGDLTDDKHAEHDLLVEERGKVAKRLEMAKAAQARVEERQRLEDEAKKAARPQPGDNRQTDASSAPSPKSNNAAHVPAIVIRRGGVPKNFRVGSAQERQEKAYRFGMYGLAMISMQVGGQFRNRDAETFFDKEFAAVHQSNNATGAHILIPEEFGGDLIDLRERYGVARRLLKMEPMTSDTKVIPRRASGLTATFVAESTAGTESNKTWNDVRLTAKDLMVISRWSGQVDMDSVINFGDDLANEISYAFALKEDQCAFIGTGASTYGGISGVVTQMGSAGTQTQASSNTWSAITLADFNNCVGLLPQYADTPNAAWVAHKTFYHGVMQKLELAAGGVTAMEIASGDRRPRPMFLGYPVEFAQVMPSATAVATISALLGDFALAGTFGDRMQESLAFSKEATINSESLFERNQLAIRGIQRFDINIHDAGTSSAAGPVVALKTGA